MNNNKPEFPNCDTYSSIAKIEEGEYKTNAPVILKVPHSNICIMLGGNGSYHHNILVKKWISTISINTNQWCQLVHSENSIQVEATDDDSAPNGEIVYSLYYSQSESRKAFIINSETGELKPSPFVHFDREQRAQEEVTVKVS